MHTDKAHALELSRQALELIGKSDLTTEDVRWLNEQTLSGFRHREFR